MIDLTNSITETINYILLQTDGGFGMLVNKVEICGVNTSKLPVLSNERMKELFALCTRVTKVQGRNYQGLRLVLRL